MRKVIRENAYVAVEPRGMGDFGSFRIGGRGTRAERAEYLERAANQMMPEIRRHIDDVADVRVHYETVTVCGYGEWNTDGEGNLLGRWPECCTRDQAEFYAEHAEESDEWFFERGMDDPDYFREFRNGEYPVVSGVDE